MRLLQLWRIEMGHFKTRYLLSVLFLLFSDTLQQQQNAHNGGTVDHMLLSSCKDCSSTLDGATTPGPQGDEEEELCWGYEKGCSNKRRLFVPQCEQNPSRSR